MAYDIFTGKQKTEAPVDSGGNFDIFTGAPKKKEKDISSVVSKVVAKAKSLTSSADSFSHDSSEYAGMTREQKKAQFQLEADQANEIAGKKNSAFGIYKEAIKPSTVSQSFRKVAKDIVQGSARSGGQVGLSIAGVDELPETKASKVIFGEKPLRSIQGSVEQTKKDLISAGLSESFADSASLPLVLGSIAADFMGGGGEKSAFKGTIPKEILEYFAKTNDIAELKNALKPFKLTEETLNPLVKSLSEAKTVQEVTDVLLNRAKTGAKAAETVDAPLIGEAPKSLAEAKSVIKSTVAEVKARPEPVPKLTTLKETLPNPTNEKPLQDNAPLIEEAKKYKSAEESTPQEMNITQYTESVGAGDNFGDLLAANDPNSMRYGENNLRKNNERILSKQDKYYAAREDYRSLVKEGKIIDPSGEFTREGLLKSDANITDKKTKSEINQIERQIQNIENLGTMSHKKDGSLKPTYQKTVDIYKAQLTDIYNKATTKDTDVPTKPATKPTISSIIQEYGSTKPRNEPQGENRSNRESSQGYGDNVSGSIRLQRDDVERNELEARSATAYINDNGIKPEELDRELKTLTSKGGVKVSKTTVAALKILGFPPAITDNLLNLKDKGAFSYIRLDNHVNGASSYGSYNPETDSLMLNPEDVANEYFISGDILKHELGGHAWFLKTTKAAQSAFYQDLKQNRSAIEEAWSKTGAQHQGYWEQTFDQLYNSINQITRNAQYTESLLRSHGIEDSSISFDDFMDRTLRFDEIIDSINNELKTEGLEPLILTAPETMAVNEHVAVLAQLAGNIDAQTAMLQNYLNQVENNTLEFGSGISQMNEMASITPESFQGYKDLSTKILEKLRGRTTVSKQFIQDLTNSGDVKQTERDLIRSVLANEPDTVNVKDFADKVKAELLPLTIETKTRGNAGGVSAQYEFVNLPSDLRGNVANYEEHIYESPIKTSAGEIHFQERKHPGYFGHTRVEDMAPEKMNKLRTNDGTAYEFEDSVYGKMPQGETRRVIEVQSDLYQKGRLDEQQFETLRKANDGGKGDLKLNGERFDMTGMSTDGTQVYGRINLGKEEKFPLAPFLEENKNFLTGIQKLQQYNNPSAHFRMVREEIKKAAEDGKTKLQFPTGETAMKIEGLGSPDNWISVNNQLPLGPEDLFIGREVKTYGNSDKWIITDVLGDGKFKAVPKDVWDKIQYYEKHPLEKKQQGNFGPTLENSEETFDISGKVDTSNPIYRFYEKDLGRYLKNNYDAKLITDDKGVSWYEIPVKEEYADAPVYASLKPTRTPQEILADAEQEALNKQSGGQNARLKSLTTLAKESPTYSGFVESAKKDPLFNKWKTDLDDTAQGNFADFYKKYKDNTAEIKKLENQLSREEQGLEEARKKPEAFVKAYGPDKVAKIEAKVEEIKNRIEKLKPEVPTERSIPANKITLPENLQQLKDEIEIRKSTLSDIGGPGEIAELEKYIVQSGDQAGQFPEVTGHTDASYLKRIKSKDVLEFAKNGDAIVRNWGFDSVAEAQDAMDKFLAEKENIKQLQKEFRAAKREFIIDERDRYALNSFLAREERINTLDKVATILREEGRSRKAKVDAIQNYFKLTDKELSSIIKNADYRLLSDKEFNDLLKKVQGMAYDISKKTEGINQIKYTIEEKGLKKVDNLQQAMKLPKLENMSLSQLEEFDNILQKFQRGDEFLGVRQLETIKNTNIADIKTKREALEDLLTRVKEDPKYKDITLADIQKFSIGELDTFRYDTALARRHPFFAVLVHDANLAKVSAGLRYHEFKQKLEGLINKARASRPRSAVERVAPTDDKIFNWLEHDADNKAIIAKTMTPEELDAAHFIQEEYAKVRDYWIQKGTLNAYRSDYITHIRRSFLEAVLRGEPGVKTHLGNRLKTAFKELFDVYKQDEAVFNILNGMTGEILPLEKFFQFSMKRSGNLVPTKNVAHAVLRYFQTFEKKIALDALIPKIDIYTHALTPDKKTEKGLFFDPSVPNFVKKWLNTKKGRVVDSVFAPGGKLDWALRSLVAITRMRDLAINIPVGIASNFGAQIAAFTPLGPKKYALGMARTFNKKGKEIAKKYESFVGETFIARMHDLSKGVGDKFIEASFGLFSAADRQSRLQYLLGSMTPAEFKAGEMSPERLADLKTEMGRYLPIDGDESVMGKTALGKVATQYKGWAVQIVATTYDNLKQLKKMAQAKDFKGAAKSKEFGELLRGTVATAVLGMLAFGAYTELKNKKGKTFVENLAYKSMNDALSLLGALDFSLWTKFRTVQFLDDLSTSMTNIAISLFTDQEADFKKLGDTLLPHALKGSSEKNDKEKVSDTISTATKTAATNLKKLDSSIVDPAQEAWNKVKEVGAGTEEGDAVVDGLSDQEYEAYKLVKASDEEYWTGIAKKVTPIVQDAYKAGFGTPEADALVDDLSDEEYKSYQQIKKSLYGTDTGGDVVGDPAEKEFGDGTTEWDKQSFFTHLENLAKGWGTSLPTAFDNLVHGDWKIVALKNGQIIVDRAPVERTQAIKESLGAKNKNFKLDHVVPKEVGGTNRMSNLNVISTKDWEENSPVENYLGRALGAGKITGKQAREYIIRYKKGAGQKLSEDLEKEYADDYNSQPLTFDQIKSEVK